MNYLLFGQQKVCYEIHVKHKQNNESKHLVLISLLVPHAFLPLAQRLSRTTAITHTCRQWTSAFVFLLSFFLCDIIKWSAFAVLAAAFVHCIPLSRFHRYPHTREWCGLWLILLFLLPHVVFVFKLIPLCVRLWVGVYKTCCHIKIKNPSNK